MHETIGRESGRDSRVLELEGRPKNRRLNVEETVLRVEWPPRIESVHLIMIAMELLFGVQINSEMVMPITLSGVNLKTKVEALKQEAAERWNLPKDSFGKNDFALFGVFVRALCTLCFSNLSLTSDSLDSVIFKIHIKTLRISTIFNGLDRKSLVFNS